jgi:hypothetical protein
MLRIPHLLLLALLALALGAAPALAAAPAPSSTVVTTDPGDEWEDWGDEDEWDDDECLASDDDACWEDEDLCWSEDEEWSDEDPGDEWGDEEEWGDEDEWDEEWDEECDEEVVAPPVVSTLRATPERRGRLRIAFQLDRAGDVTLALQRVGGRGKASRACAKPARRGAKAPRRACVAAPTGTVTVAGRSGANATTLKRWNGRRLAPGTYRLTATPTAEGAREATTTFTLRAPARRR